MRNGISGTECSPKHYTQIKSIVTIYTVYWSYTMPTVMAQYYLRNWTDASGNQLQVPLDHWQDQTCRYYVMRWSSPKHYWHVTLRLYIIGKRTAMDSQPLFPQLSMLYVHTCIKQMTLWRWTNPINGKVYFQLRPTIHNLYTMIWEAITIYSIGACALGKQVIFVYKKPKHCMLSTNRTDWGTLASFLRGWQLHLQQRTDNSAGDRTIQSSKRHSLDPGTWDVCWLELLVVNYLQVHDLMFVHYTWCYKY